MPAIAKNNSNYNGFKISSCFNGIFQEGKPNQKNVQLKWTKQHSPEGIITHAIPATNRFPIVQKAAIKLSIDPRLDFG